MEDRPPLEGYRYRKTLGTIIAVVVIVALAIAFWQWHKTADHVPASNSTNSRY
jgi:hypothetical protein